jgi:hypothetical protein
LQVNAIELVGLKQAAYVLRCLVEGQSKKEVVSAFEEDEQLVDMWILFLKHNHWMEESSNGRWSLTAKGQVWAGKVGTNGDT